MAGGRRHLQVWIWIQEWDYWTSEQKMECKGAEVQRGEMIPYNLNQSVVENILGTSEESGIDTSHWRCKSEEDISL